MGRGNGYDHDVSAVRGNEDRVEVGADATWRVRVLSDTAKLRPVDRGSRCFGTRAGEDIARDVSPKL